MASTALQVEAQKEVTRLRDLKIGARDLFTLRPQDIEIETGHNPRDYNLPENRAHIDELKASIGAIGVQVPLLVRFDGATKRALCVDGECRLRATLELIAEGSPIEGIPVIQVPGNNEADRLVIALTANTGKPLSKWESGSAFQRLLNFGWTEERIAEKLGFSLVFIKDALTLADAPEEVKKMLSAQAVTPALAIQQIKASGNNGAEVVAALKAKASAAAAQGKKTATRAQENPVPNVKVILNLVAKLVSSAEDDLFGTDMKWVEVDTATMRKLASYVGVRPKDGETPTPIKGE